MLSTNVEDVHLLRQLRHSMLLQYSIHCFTRTRSQRHLPFPQGHIKAAEFIGFIYHWGHGVAVDYERAMAAYKIAAEAGEATSQWQVGMMYYEGHGVAVDYEQARPWFEKAAAQDHPDAVGQLGTMYFDGKGVTTSWRRAREYYQRAIALGNPQAVKNMQKLTRAIAAVTSSGKPPSTTPTRLAELPTSYPISYRRSPP